MFLVQLSVMGWGVFHSLKEDKAIKYEGKDPLEGILFSSGLLVCTNFAVVEEHVQSETVSNQFKYLIDKIYDSSELLGTHCSLSIGSLFTHYVALSGPRCL